MKGLLPRLGFCGRGRLCFVDDVVDVFFCSCLAFDLKECYLVDPASSHMIVSYIKLCMCKYELIQTMKMRIAH